jgi:hypothetical protein
MNTDLSNSWWHPAMCEAARLGQELKRLDSLKSSVLELSTKLKNNGTHVTFAKPVYLLIDFLYGSKFNVAFGAGA